jgi:hypothetical protein
MEWIRVDDMLPEVGRTVIAFWPPYLKGSDVTGRNYSIAQYSGSEHWHNPEDDEDDYSVPSHWMPLPNPPKGE